MKIVRLCEVIAFTKLLSLVSSYEATIQCRYADTGCPAGEMVNQTATCPSYNPE